MRSSSITSPLAAILLAATTVSAQSPNGTDPAVNGTFGVAYNTTLIDGSQPLLFAPSRRWYHDAIPGFKKAEPPSGYTVLRNQPNISAEGNWQDNTTSPSNTTSSLYQVLMIDLSLPASRLAGVDPALIAPGAGENRTTRLHWWAGNLTSTPFEGMESNTTYPFSSFLVSNDTPVASYQGPGPPEGDSVHYYVFYLFAQPENFTLPANAASGNYSGYLDGRANFNVTPVIEAAGQPLAATYLLAQANATGIANATMA